MAADYSHIQGRVEFQSPFQAELLSVYLIRLFSIDIVEHLAKVKGGESAVLLAPEVRHILGIGNSTGLGMAPYIVNHPQLLHNWINAREQALCRVRNVEKASNNEIKMFKKLLVKMRLSNQLWYSKHPIQSKKNSQLNSDGEQFKKYISQLDFSTDYVWDKIYRYCRENLSMEAQEQINMLMIEPYAAMVDELGATMSDNGEQASAIKGNVEDTIQCIEQYCQWAIKNTTTSEQHWYISENKLEPRFGKHIHNSIVILPLNIMQQINEFYQQLLQYERQQPLAAFLLKYPQFRFIAKRTALIQQLPYMEIHDDMTSSKTMPVDLLRLKLSFFGATRFDPRSDRWVRINMFQYAPYPNELLHSKDNWVFPVED